MLNDIADSTCSPALSSASRRAGRTKGPVGLVARTACLCAALAAATALVGCGPSRLRISDDQAKLPVDDGSAAYLDRISSETVVSQNDAFRGILLLLDIGDDDGTFGQRVDILTKAGVVDQSWQFDAGRAISKGQVAYMIYQACGVHGGVILSLTGPSRRYCLRELQYQGFMSEGTMFTTVSGGEYVAVLSRADSCRRTGKVPEITTTSGE